MSRYVLDSQITTPFISLSDMKDWLRVTGTLQDDLITCLIEAAVIEAENIMNRAILTKTWSNYRESFHEDLTLRRGAFQSIVAIQYLKDGIYVLLDSDDYNMSIGGIFGFVCRICIPSDVDCDDCNAIRIIFKSGFGDDPSFVPKDIITAIKLIVSDMYSNRGDCPDGCNGEGGINKTATTILNGYKILHLPVGDC